MDIAIKLNVLAVCAAFVFVSAILLGPFEFRKRDPEERDEGSSEKGRAGYGWCAFVWIECAPNPISETEQYRKAVSKNTGAIVAPVFFICRQRSRA